MYCKLRSTVWNLKHPEISGEDTHFDNAINIIMWVAHVFACVISLCFVVIAVISYKNSNINISNNQTWYDNSGRMIESIFYLIDSVILVVGTMLLFFFARNNDHLFS